MFHILPHRNDERISSICCLTELGKFSVYSLTNFAQHIYRIYQTIRTAICISDTVHTWLSPERVGCFSVLRIFPIKSHSRRRWSIIASFLLSKHDTIILSTWWCSALLYGYLHSWNKQLKNEFSQRKHKRCVTTKQSKIWSSIQKEVFTRRTDQGLF